MERASPCEVHGDVKPQNVLISLGQASFRPLKPRNRGPEPYHVARRAEPQATRRAGCLPGTTHRLRLGTRDPRRGALHSARGPNLAEQRL